MPLASSGSTAASQDSKRCCPLPTSHTSTAAAGDGAAETAAGAEAAFRGAVAGLVALGPAGEVASRAGQAGRAVVRAGIQAWDRAHVDPALPAMAPFGLQEPGPAHVDRAADRGGLQDRGLPPEDQPETWCTAAARA